MGSDAAVALGRMAAVEQDGGAASGHHAQESRGEARVMPGQDRHGSLETHGRRPHRRGDRMDLRPKLAIGQGAGVVLHRHPIGETIRHQLEAIEDGAFQRGVGNGFEGQDARGADARAVPAPVPATEQRSPVDRPHGASL